MYNCIVLFLLLFASWCALLCIFSAFRLMASSNEMCFFCGDVAENPQNEWSLKNSTNAQICHLCSLTFEQGTFCHLFHGHEDGWRNCDSCGKLVHYGCNIAFNAFELNERGGVTCKECFMKRDDVATEVISSSSPLLNSNDCFQLDNFDSSTHILVPGDLADPKDADEATIEGSLNISSSQNSDLLFLFEKKLTTSDCDVKLGRFLVPKQCAENCFPRVGGSNSIPLLVADRRGKSWQFVLCWWLNKRSRKYVFYGTRKCIQAMQWNAGDTVKFYRNIADGKLIIELERIHATTSASVASAHGDGTST